jgi:hypothetical protein
MTTVWTFRGAVAAAAGAAGAETSARGVAEAGGQMEFTGAGGVLVAVGGGGVGIGAAALNAGTFCPSPGVPGWAAFGTPA